MTESGKADGTELVTQIREARRMTYNDKIYSRQQFINMNQRIDQDRINRKMDKYYQDFYNMWKDFNMLIAIIAMIGILTV